MQINSSSSFWNIALNIDKYLLIQFYYLHRNVVSLILSVSCKSWGKTHYSVLNYYKNLILFKVRSYQMFDYQVWWLSVSISVILSFCISKLYNKI